MSPKCENGHFTPDLSLVNTPCSKLIQKEVRVRVAFWAQEETQWHTVPCGKVLLASPKELIEIRELEKQKDRENKQGETFARLQQQKDETKERAALKALARSRRNQQSRHR
jgi:hypothetical protein